ncbi:hypothetical protein GGI21_004147 [Coemansia aciculifera]|nr:hypothetical protein GGI21_004147 [Coemansia aciculifera]
MGPPISCNEATQKIVLYADRGITMLDESNIDIDSIYFAIVEKTEEEKDAEKEKNVEEVSEGNAEEVENAEEDAEYI